MSKLSRFLIFTLLLIALFTQTAPIYATNPLDRIYDYNITVSLRDDGSLDMHYRFKWEVIDSTSEGPLEWVKIGIPNKHVDEITPLSSNIKGIRYYAEGSKTYIRVDFDRAYYANEIIDFEFSFHQSYMYIMDEETNKVTYNFTPGWFDEIYVNNLTVRWESSNVRDISSNNMDGNYYIWKQPLQMGERLNLSVEYDRNSYNFDTEKQSDDSNGGGRVLIIVLLVVFGVLILIFVIDMLSGNDYDSGFGGGSGGGGSRTTYIHTTSRSPSRSSSCVRSSCACACACACAGGGRAGCSTKDFYGTKMNTKRLKRVINKKTKDAK